MATVKAQGDAMVLTMVGRGPGMAILLQLSPREAGDTVEITGLGPCRPVRKVGCVTSPESASAFAVCALIRELRSEKSSSGGIGGALAGGAASQIVGSPSKCGDIQRDLP